MGARAFPWMTLKPKMRRKTMIVQRISYYPKPRCWEDLVDLLRVAMQQSLSNPHLLAFRPYRRQAGSSAPVAVEPEFENNEEIGEFWADVNADPGSGTFRERYVALVNRIMTSELWEMVE